MSFADHTLDYIIIGQGLAGSILAWKMSVRGNRVAVVCDASCKSASLVAAGIINPIAGKRLAKGWNIESTLPAAKKIYHELESYFNKPFFEPRPIIRLYQSAHEQNCIKERMSDQFYQSALSFHEPGMHAERFKDLLGGFTIHGGGIVAVKELISILSDFFKEKESLYDETFDPRELRMENGLLSWKNLKAKRIVFCEGYQGMHNPWFKWLPFEPAKGEILTISTNVPAEYTSTILNKGMWLFSQKDGCVKLGATYNRKELSESPTQLGKEELLKGFRELIRSDKDCDIVAHEAGIRPCTKDSRPFVGVHPMHKQLIIFNGFGSKGTLLIPYLAEKLIEHLENGIPIHAEVSIERHWKE